ncbi:tol-pal system-associated acyl-CoA thioesterase [Microvirga alba]|uniref:Tol-pal system-associated acyl-CoA thioesterase n=1 Tax=Microvirga alba TaxID=2791025 RepID=A0A931BPY6_9HYPH|nr:tol-pal system-associated acyl-CoA thioesterase [Microvirga alba]MBF9234821.1 tol-pal system-associated acyl-CoA thioesterase [Microvirga alba]
MRDETSRGAGEQAGAWPHLSGALKDGAHVLPIRVYYEDTDFSARVYHASYLRFMERGRTELLRAVEVAQSDLHAEMGGLAFVVRKMMIDFRGAALMDDVLTIVTRPKEMRGASMTLAQEVRRGDDVLVFAEVTVAAVRGGRAVRIPDELRAALTPLGE